MHVRLTGAPEMAGKATSPRPDLPEDRGGVTLSHVTVYLRHGRSFSVSPSTGARLVKDVSQLGHAGTGDLEIRIRTAADLERARPLLRRSYQGA